MFMTGLATNAVSLAMGGDATFNLASAYGGLSEARKLTDE